ncbi:Uncharacterised protein [Mycobacterium tuberculosis]|nr:Uncharacterised protein [Streptococcus pneumoniae]CKU71972.1 Uncharacterised protein [Mycobacterium tuberculosis]VJJ45830.1 Uncharacterised protein [Streptococcus pneumoniae]
MLHISATRQFKQGFNFSINGMVNQGILDMPTIIDNSKEFLTDFFNFMFHFEKFVNIRIGINLLIDVATIGG